MNLVSFGIASVVSVAGIACLLLAALRSRDRLFFWVGCFSILYGCRLFLENPLVWSATNVDQHQFLLWRLGLTYLIPIPYALFGRELLDAGWKKSITVWVGIEIIFAVLAIPGLILPYPHGWVDNINAALVIGGSIVILLHVFLQRENASPFAKGLAWPLVIFAAFVVLRNWQYTRTELNTEPLGFLFLLAGLGATAARRTIAQERALLEVEQELTTARRIQGSIIPHRPPDIAGINIALRYQPMTAVAGDFFDFLITSETSLTILVADVSGHGIPAALVASTLKVSFAAQRERAKNPAHVLAGLNTMLRGSLGGQYVTAACAAIDLAAQTITYAGAGHPPSLLLQRNKRKIVELAENGLFIGPFPQATYSNIAVPFESGDKLLLYTDGITEATGLDGQEFGQKRLELFLLESADLTPAQFVEQLFQQIWMPKQQDDLTVVFAELEV